MSTHPTTHAPFLATACLFLMGMAIACRANVATEIPETWDSGLRGWTNAGTAVTLDNPAQFLRMTFAPTNLLSPENEADTIYAFYPPASNMFIGDYVAANARKVVFDFLASNTAPSEMKLQFQSSGSGSSDVWSYPLNLPPVGVWTPYLVPFTYSAGWSDGFGRGGAEFLKDLESVDWIGIYIRRAGSGREEYGLDDFTTLYAPEPGELTLLGAALLGLAGTFRRRTRQLLTGVRAAVRLRRG